MDVSTATLEANSATRTVQLLFTVPYVPSLIRVRPYQFLRELAQRHEITLLTADTPSALEKADELRAWCKSVEMVPLRTRDMLASCARGALRGDPLQAAVCQSVALERRFNALVASHHFDLVHVEHLRAAALQRLIPVHLPAVFDSVDSISLLLRRTLRSSHSLRQRLIAAAELHRTALFEGRVLRAFDATVVTSSDDQRALHDLAPGASIEVIPNGVDLGYFQPLTDARDPETIVFSGKMSYHANVTAVLYFVERILPLIRKVRPSVRLCIVGSQPTRAILALRADPGIEVTGQVPDLRSYVGHAAVAVCPMTVKVGIQNKLLEAMAMATPVVATRLAAEGLQASPGRDFLVAESAPAFADHVLRLLADVNLARAVGTAGRAYVEASHRWERAAESLEAVYAAALARHAQRGPAVARRYL